MGYNKKELFSRHYFNMTEQGGEGIGLERRKWGVVDVQWMVADMVQFLGLATKLPKEFYSLGTRMERARAEKEINNYAKGEGIRKTQAYRELAGSGRIDPERMKALKEFDRQFLSPERLKIELGVLGEQEAEFNRVRIEEIANREENKNKPPVYLVPAFSGDRYGVLPLMRELALAGYTVYCLDHPESHNGKTTNRFVVGMEGSLANLGAPNQMEPHTSWFRKGLERVSSLEKGKKLIVMGYSTGGPIVKEMANDPRLVGKVDTWVALAPASCVSQTYEELIKEGLRGEFMKNSLSGRLFSDQGVVFRKRSEANESDKKRRGKMGDFKKGIRSITGALVQKVCRKTDAWEMPMADPDSRFILFSGSQDEFTKTATVSDWLKNLSGVRVIERPGWTHLGPLLHAGDVVQTVGNIREEKQ